MQSTFKLGAIALAATLCSAAMADMKITGVIDGGYVTTNNTGSSANKTISGAASSILGVSNVGISGDKDFGDGATGFFNFQAGFNPTDGKMSDTSTLFSRNAYVGLKGSAGSVSLGRQWNLNDDWLVGSVFKGGYNAGAVFKFSEFDAVSDIYSKSIKYVTPTMGAFQGAVMYGSKLNSDSTGSLSNLGLKYAEGPIYAAATVFNEKSTTDTTYKLITMGASYTMGVYKPRIGYASSDIAAGTFVSVGTFAAATKANVTNLGIDYAVNPKLTVSLDSLKRKNTTLSNDSTVTRLLAIYSWRPDVAFVGNVARISNSRTASQSLSSESSGWVAGQSQQSVAMGVRVTF